MRDENNREVIGKEISLNCDLDALDGFSAKTNINSNNKSYTVDVSAPEVSVYNTKKSKISPLMRRTSFQARLGKKLDRISRKAIDNQIRLTSHPTDMIRVKVSRDSRSQDLISRTITDMEILPIILPPMEDVPMRRLIRDDKPDVLVPSLYPTSNTTMFELYAPLEVSLDEDDLLIRLIEDPLGGSPYILCLQVKEILGTLGYSSFRYQKFWATLYDESLPSQVIRKLEAAIKRRDQLGW